MLDIGTASVVGTHSAQARAALVGGMSMLEKMSLAFVVALAATPVPAFAWSDNFNSGLHNAWIFGFVDDIGDPPDTGSYSASATNNILLFSASNAALPDGGGGPASGYGYVGQTFLTTSVRGSVNVGASPSPVNQLGLLARGNPTTGAAYLFEIDFDAGVALLGRSDSFLGDDLALDIGTATLLPGQSYWLELDAVGSQIIGRVYTAAGGTLLDTLTATDATYSQGVAGVVVRAYDSDGTVFGAPLHGTFDDVSALPEPSSTALLGAGLFGLVLLGAVRVSCSAGSA